MYERITSPYRGQRFSIGIYKGASLVALGDAREAANPVLTYNDVTDVPAGFVADPFMLNRDGRWFMFFEVLNRASGIGQIALATSENGLVWKYERTVLKESFHLAYPHVFTSGNDVFLIPDSPDMGIRLYRAARFPFEWETVNTLLPGNFSDSSIFRHDNSWWILSAWRERKEDQASLRLFRSAQLPGPWREHPASPLVSMDARIARSAGRVQVLDGKIIRFAQDCSKVYGKRVRAFEITSLTPSSYAEQEVAGPVLQPGDKFWNSGGMHHLDAHNLQPNEWLACVDGWHDVSGKALR